MKLRGIEFYTTPAGEVMVKPDSESVRMLTDNYPNDRELITLFLEYIAQNYTEAYKSLCELYSRASANRYYFEFQIVSRFIRCNFGSYDTRDFDIDLQGRFNFEQVNCPLRSECRLENICCNPKFNTELSFREMEVYRLVVEGYSSEEIADILSISPFTINAHRRHLYTKTNTKTTAELINYWHSNKLK